MTRAAVQHYPCAHAHASIFYLLYYYRVAAVS